MNQVLNYSSKLIQIYVNFTSNITFIITHSYAVCLEKDLKIKLYTETYIIICSNKNESSNFNHSCR